MFVCAMMHVSLAAADSNGCRWLIVLLLLLARAVAAATDADRGGGVVVVVVLLLPSPPPQPLLPPVLPPVLPPLLLLLPLLSGAASAVLAAPSRATCVGTRSSSAHTTPNGSTCDAADSQAQPCETARGLQALKHVRPRARPPTPAPARGEPFSCFVCVCVHGHVSDPAHPHPQQSFALCVPRGDVIRIPVVRHETGGGWLTRLRSALPRNHAPPASHACTDRVLVHCGASAQSRERSLCRRGAWFAVAIVLECVPRYTYTCSTTGVRDGHVDSRAGERGAVFADLAKSTAVKAGRQDNGSRQWCCWAHLRFVVCRSFVLEYCQGCNTRVRRMRLDVPTLTPTGATACNCLPNGNYGGGPRHGLLQ